MISREDTALMIVDMQNGFLDARGSLAAVGMPYEQLRPAIDGCMRLVDAAREVNVPVIFTRYVYLPDYSDAGLLPTELVPAMKDKNALITGSWDADVIEALTPQPGDVVIDKSRPSSFYGTRLEPVLTNLGIRSLVIAGVTTNICVETTARDAGQRDYRVHVVSDATAEYDPARYESALAAIGLAFGWVNTTDDVLASWGLPSHR